MLGIQEGIYPAHTIYAGRMLYGCQEMGLATCLCACVPCLVRLHLLPSTIMVIMVQATVAVRRSAITLHQAAHAGTAFSAAPGAVCL